MHCCIKITDEMIHRPCPFAEIIKLSTGIFVNNLTIYEYPFPFLSHMPLSMEIIFLFVLIFYYLLKQIF